MAMTQETSQGQVLPLNNILSLVQLQQEIDTFGYTTLTFQLLNTLAADIINIY
jgi:hypothetical protein